MSFIKTPNLPQGRVKTAIVSGESPAVNAALKELGIQALSTEKRANSAKPVEYHADMLTHHLGENRIILSNEQTKLNEVLSRYGFDVEIIKVPLGEKYPDDCRLNCARVGDKLIGGEKIAPEIEEYCTANAVDIIRVKQGYSKCSVCVVNDSAIITADNGIADAAGKNRIDVLKIKEGFIKINCYNYGFIGGASCKLSKDILGFFGDINFHPDAINIKAFLRNYGIYPEKIISGALIDIGGMIPITELI